MGLSVYVNLARKPSSLEIFPRPSQDDRVSARLKPIVLCIIERRVRCNTRPTKKAIVGMPWRIDVFCRYSYGDGPR